MSYPISNSRICASLFLLLPVMCRWVRACCWKGACMLVTVDMIYTVARSDLGLDGEPLYRVFTLGIPLCATMAQ